MSYKPGTLTSSDYGKPNGVCQLNTRDKVSMSDMAHGEVRVEGMVAVIMFNPDYPDQVNGLPQWFQLCDADGKILMDNLPTNLTDALTAVVEQQQKTNDRLQETNELLLRLFQQQAQKNEQEGIVTDGLCTTG